MNFLNSTHKTCLLILFLLIHANASAAPSSAYDGLATQIIDACQEKQLIVLGENHQQKNSTKLLVSLVRKFACQNKKILVGLEIPRDRQEPLDNALHNPLPISEGIIPLIIDHADYHTMLHELQQLNIDIKAIDATEEENNREQAMFDFLIHVIASEKYDKILVLVGNLHAIKNVKWHPDTGHAESDDQFFTGKLIQDGRNVCSVVQDFSPQETDNPRVLTTNSSEGAAGAMRTIRAVFHNDNMSGKDVADAVVVW